MLDERTRSVMQQTARRLARSFLQYVREAGTWATSEDEPAVEHLRQLADEERDAIAKLMVFLQRQHATPPYLGSFPSSFTTVNFVTLDYLRPLLIKHTRAEIGRLEEDLRLVSDLTATSLLKELLSLKKRHLEELEHLKQTANAHAAPATAASH